MIDKYNFQVGERVLDIFGRKGTIIHTCHCSECERRGFYEFVVKWNYKPNEEDWFTDYDEKNGFSQIHKIGRRIFNPLDLEKALAGKKEIQEQINELQEQKRYLSKGIELIRALNRLDKLKEYADNGNK